MALKNYKVTYEDGSETYYQFEEDDAGLKALKDAAANKANPVKSVAAGEPSPFNK
jgi:hypothetical protein